MSLSRFIDCHVGDDETFVNTCALSLTHRFQCLSNDKECLPRNMLLDSIWDCVDGSDELYPFSCKHSDDFGCQLIRDGNDSPLFGSYLFQELCNGIQWGRLSINNETDETSCVEWSYDCNSPYVLCDGIWNCKDGRDEINCSSNFMPVTNCFEHYCRDINDSTSLKCLPLEKAGDHVIDCLGETDERFDGFCSKKYPMNLRKRYRCEKSDICIDPVEICNGLKDCPNHDDETLCPWMLGNPSSSEFKCVPNNKNKSRATRCDIARDCLWGEDEWLCNIVEKRADKPFLLNRIVKKFETGTETTVRQQQERRLRVSDKENIQQAIRICLDECYNGNLWGDDTFTIQQSACCKNCELCILQGYRPKNISDCHRGLPILLYYNLGMAIDKVESCFCSPMYYGQTCKYQSERITVMLQIETFGSYNTVSSQSSALIFFISLLYENDTAVAVDNEKLIVSPYIQATHKYMIYLLYPRPKLPGQYFVKIDSYLSNTSHVKYTGKSWYYNVQFPFLPVGRLALRLVLDDRIDGKHNAVCKNFTDISRGRCLTYVNNDTKLFLSCRDEWTGEDCNLKSNHLCANGSQCVYGCDKFHKANCICPLGRIGDHCYIIFNPCLNVQCKNGGTRVPLDERTLHYFCACSEGFFGVKCENVASNISISLPASLLTDVSYIPAVIVHFDILKSSATGIMVHRNQFLFTNFDLKHTQLIVKDDRYENLPTFVLLQIFLTAQNRYGMFYIIEILQNYNVKSLNSSALASNYCPHVSELLNKSINAYISLKRVKYYHQICTSRSSPKCFFDEIYMCFCDYYSHADCLIYDHANIDCGFCQNQGRCITVQKQLTCICPECYYGSVCQFTTLKYSVTLDSLLTYETLSSTPSLDRSIVVKLVAVILIAMIVVGLIGNSMCFFVFLHRNARETGCGYYLLCLSFVHNFVLCTLGTRFYFAVFNSSLSFLNCVILEYLLQYFPYVSDWLTSAIAIERTITVCNGVYFNKQTSIKVAKLTIISISLIVAIGLIHILFSYDLVVNPLSPNSVSCIKITKSKIIEIYGSVINIIQLIVPFLINISSTSIFIVKMTRRKMRDSTHRNSGIKITFWHTVRKQLLLYKPFIISPLIIVCLLLPRLIVSFALMCVKHSWQNYLYLTGYIISFGPSMGTIFIFVLPSPTYRQILVKPLSIKR